MAAFQALVPVLIYGLHGKKLVWAIGIYLLIPALMAVSYQLKLKEYNLLMKTLYRETSSTENQSLILTNNFIDFSKEVLFPGNQMAKDLLFPIEKLDSLKVNPPQNFRVLVYDYYKHGYPKEQVDIDVLELWLKDQKLLNETREGLVWIRNYEFEKN